MKAKHSLPHILLLSAVIAWSLTGCGTPPIKPTVGLQPASNAVAQDAMRNGEYVLAAREYQRLAEDADTPIKQEYQLKAIDALIKAGQLGDARKQLASVTIPRFDENLTARQRILQAAIASHEGDKVKAIRLLDRAGRVRGLDPSLYSEIYRAKADAEQTLGNPIAAVTNLIARGQYLSDPVTVDRNQLEIWEILSALPLSELRSHQTLARDPVLSGWLELVLTFINEPRAFGKLARQWKKDHPDHPVSTTLLETLTSPAPRYVGRVDRIALLLPLTSRYGTLASAVKDGFAAMHQADPRPDKPSVLVYDIGNETADVTRYYNIAVQEGAQLVVGPLGRESVDHLVKNGELTTPTVLLSHTEEDTDSNANALFQFGLPPEQEAMQAAERAYLDGRRQAAILYPASQWGERMAKAFADHWLRLGGIILKMQPYHPEDSDFSAPIKDLLNITQSETRKQLLETALKTRLSFNPRRRQDVDCIFLAANARNGRLIKPQLNYHNAARVPVYATSHIFNAKEDPVYDADLDGVMFGDMPWLLLQDGAIGTLQQATAGRSYTNTPLDRLFALGMDAYTLIPQLNRLSSEGAVRFNGVTSGLSVSQSGRVQRQLVWARFKQGLPRPLDTFYYYSGQNMVQDAETYRATSAKGL